jgi:predicted PurR-regulated permease PerM
MSFTSLVLVLAAIAVVLGALHFGSSLVTPVFLATVLALIFWPPLLWLRGRGLPNVLALIALFVALIVASTLIALLIAYSVNGLASRLTLYADHLSAELQSVDAWLQSQGLADPSLASMLPPEAILAAFSAGVGFLLAALQQAVVIMFMLLFFLAEGPAVMRRLRASLAADDPNSARLATYGHDVGEYFILRAAVNALTGAGVALVLWLLGVDFPLLWGVLTFFLSFIPYVGMFLASVPSVLLAWAEFDLAHALVVVVALTVVNATAENLVQPALMHKGLHLSPTFVFLSVFFWAGLLGGSGSFLAVPLSLGLLAILANFPAARWFVNAVVTRPDAPTQT